ncbi:MAG: rRNA maturation RNase YbeY [Hyphomicrobiaceae bacterium]
MLCELHIDPVDYAGDWSRAKPGDLGLVARAIVSEIRSVPGLDFAGVATIVYADDETIRRLNRAHRDIDKPTNVLSYPASGHTMLDQREEPAALGDVVLALETIEAEALELGISAGDHTIHLIVHGILHLLGYDHEQEDEADVMEARERAILAMLGLHDPYPEARCPGE